MSMHTALDTLLLQSFLRMHRAVLHSSSRALVLTVGAQVHTIYERG